MIHSPPQAKPEAEADGEGKKEGEEDAEAEGEAAEGEKEEVEEKKPEPPKKTFDVAGCRFSSKHICISSLMLQRANVSKYHRSIRIQAGIRWIDADFFGPIRT